MLEQADYTREGGYGVKIEEVVRRNDFESVKATAAVEPSSRKPTKAHNGSCAWTVNSAVFRGVGG